MQTAKGQAFYSCFGMSTLLMQTLQKSFVCVQMVLLVDSLRHTGCGDAFAQLKVNK